MKHATLDEEAADLHERYLSYKKAGFTEEQAIDLIKFVMVVVLGDEDARPEE